MVWPDLRVSRCEIFSLDIWPEARKTRAFVLQPKALHLFKRNGNQVPRIKGLADVSSGSMPKVMYNTDEIAPNIVR